MSGPYSPHHLSHSHPPCVLTADARSSALLPAPPASGASAALPRRVHPRPRRATAESAPCLCFCPEPPSSVLAPQKPNRSKPLQNPEPTLLRSVSTRLFLSSST